MPNQIEKLMPELAIIKTVICEPTMSEYAEAYFDECMALKAEVERLRVELNKAQADALIANMRYVDPEGDRAKVIEQCARVVDGYKYLANVAKAIRALKDKP